MLDVLNTPTPANDIPQVSLNNLRREERRVFREPPPGKFSVVVAAREIAVQAVHDVSASGIRLQLPEAPGIAVRVEVRYRHGELDLRLNGITCWQSAAATGPAGAHMVGIDLMTPTVLINIL